MGTLAKRLGQLATRSLESESSNIIKTISANKTGLSKALDTTLRTSHDMKVFGLGTAASMASLPRYSRFTASMHAVYSAMESRMDQCESPAVGATWGKFADSLRRADALRADLEEARLMMNASGFPAADQPLSAATKQYVAAIDAAAASDNETGGARLLGHLYCRYFADLFGGQALGGPYRWALGLGATSPRHYDFGEFGLERRASIERIYESLNESGEMLPPEAREAVLEEARVAFRHNVYVYSEEGRLVIDGALGMAKMAGGFARSRLSN